jgi:PiT family inorganic phosphate transporter
LNKVFWLFAWTFPILYILLRVITHNLTIKFKDRQFGVEHVVRRFQARTSCLIGFDLGSDEVANSVFPVIAIFFMNQLGIISDSFANHSVPIQMLRISGLGMSMVFLCLRHRVIGTMGRSLTLLSNSKGFRVDFSTAMMIVSASVRGMPMSSTHAATGSVIGAALEKISKGGSHGYFSQFSLHDS